MCFTQLQDFLLHALQLQATQTQLQSTVLPARMEQVKTWPKEQGAVPAWFALAVYSSMLWVNEPENTQLP
jgi:hypothetical protein